MADPLAWAPTPTGGGPQRRSVQAAVSRGRAGPRGAGGLAAAALEPLQRHQRGERDCGEQHPAADATVRMTDERA